MISSSGPRTQRFDLFSVLTGLMIFGVLFLIVLPIGRMIIQTFWVDGQLRLAEPFSVLANPWVGPVMYDTAILVVVSTAISVGLGSVLAWLNERTDANLGMIGRILPVTPLLLPSVALAIGWVFIAAPRVGFLNGLLGLVPWFGDAPLSVDIYTWSGLLWVYTIHNIPMVYLLVSAALQNFDPAIEEASKISGASNWRTFYKVSLPAIRPALVASALLIAISCLAIYSIPVIIATPAGIDLLPVRIVRLLTNEFPPRMGAAQVLSVFKLLVIAGLWMVYRRIAAGGNFMTTGGRSSGQARLSLGRWKWPARAIMIAYMACASVIPLIALVVVAFQPYWTPTINFGTFTLRHLHWVLGDDFTTSALRNSLLLSCGGATIAMVVSVLIAIYLLRRSGFLAQIADAALKIPAVVPHVVTAVGFLVTFSGPPFNLSGTILILLLAFLIMYIPPGSIAANAAVAQVGKDLREASYISGAGEGRTTLRVTVPLAFPGFLAGWTMVFVHMMGDLSASALLAGIGNPVIGFAILQIWETGSFNRLAAFSMLMCIIISLVVGGSMWVVSRSVRRYQLT